jgi:hypothetical protein
MRRCLIRVLSLLTAFALVINGVPAVASAIGASDQEPSALAMHAAPTGDMSMDDCCNDCMPTNAPDRACFAMCVQLPALPAASEPMVQASRPRAFEPVALMTAHGRLIAPDPLPPRSLI